MTSFSGSIAGNVCSHNRHGAYMRAGTKPTNVRSSALCRSRSVLSLLTKKWSNALTPEQRLAWETYALGITSHNALGESIHLTGQLMFIRTNQVRISANLDICLSAPTILELGEKDPVLKISGETPPVLAVEFDDTMDWCSEDGAALIVHAGRPQKSTRNFYNGPWLYAGKISGNSVTPPTSPAVITNESPVKPEQKLFTKSIITRADGQTSNPFNLAPKGFSSRTRLITCGTTPSTGYVLRTLAGIIIQVYTTSAYTWRIHHDPINNTLWGGTPAGNHIFNLQMIGTSIHFITDGTIAEPNRAVDGAAIDTRDGTLWVNNDPGNINESLDHYKRHINGSNHFVLINSFDIHTFAPHIKDVCFDSSDNTVWMPDSSTKKIHHISTTTGLELPGTINTLLLGVPLGAGPWFCEYDHEDDTLWFGCMTTNIYHISKEGVLLESISVPDDPTGPTGCTLAPISIQG